MKILKHSVIVVGVILLVDLGMAFAGQALFAPVKDFVDGAALVAVLEVKKVTMVEVSTGEDQVSRVYVAEAEVLQTLKSDLTPIPAKRKIAIVGSEIPYSSAVWEPIKKNRYLAFLNPEQGHYHYGEKYALRAVSPEGKVEWPEKNARGEYELLSLGLDEAVKRIRSELDAGGSRR